MSSQTITELTICVECSHLMVDGDMDTGEEVCPSCGNNEAFDTLYDSEGETWANELARYHAERGQG